MKGTLVTILVYTGIKPGLTTCIYNWTLQNFSQDDYDLASHTIYVTYLTGDNNPINGFRDAYLCYVY